VNTCTRGFHRHAYRLVASIVLFGAVAGASLQPAFADVIGDKQGQAKALSDQIDALGRKQSALGEQYNAAVLAANATAAKVSKEQVAVSAAQAKAADARGALQVNALDAYIHGGSLITRAARNGKAGQADGGLLASEYVNTLAATQHEALDNFRNAATTAKELTAQLQTLQAQQAKAASATDSARRAAQSSSQQLVSTLSKVKGDIATLVAQADAAKQAAALQAAQAAAAQAAQALLAPVAAAVGGGHSIGGAATLSSAPIPVGAGASGAVAAAKSRLGMPYVWGASGPDSFDCSGLVMWAWAHAGVGLPHFSGAMYASTQHIPMSALQPGDLVFPSNPGDHVAMYIGGGQVIESPHSGAVVHIVPMYSWFVLASRV
jgi:cell wall-associated NlpC family hydrolase